MAYDKHNENRGQWFMRNPNGRVAGDGILSDDYSEEKGMRMYKSPIEIICADMQKQIDNDIYRVTQKCEIKVDKNELIQALQYDRDQYHKGYADGKRDAMEELVRCKDCKGWCPEEIAKRYGADRYCTMTMMPTDADDFCSYGERREGE